MQIFAKEKKLVKASIKSALKALEKISYCVHRWFANERHQYIWVWINRYRNDLQRLDADPEILFAFKSVQTDFEI